ncbi:hypothetical protein ACFL96_08315 [Thermoproteota archaeon]
MDDKREDDKKNEPVPAMPAEDIEEYQGINSKYVLYIVLGVVGIVMILFIIQTVDSVLHPLTGFGVYVPTILDKYIDDPKEMIKNFNKASDDMPTTLRILFGDERINTTIRRMDSSKTIMAIETKNGKIKSAKRGEMEDPTLNLELKESTIKKIYESNHPIDEIMKSLDNGEIQHESITLTSEIKMSILKAAIIIMTWFS